MKLKNPNVIFVQTDGPTSQKQYAPSTFSKQSWESVIKEPFEPIIKKSGPDVSDKKVFFFKVFPIYMHR